VKSNQNNPRVYVPHASEQGEEMSSL